MRFTSATYYIYSRCVYLLKLMNHKCNTAKEKGKSIKFTSAALIRQEIELYVGEDYIINIQIIVYIFQ